jgi:hypothetical protein
MANKPRRPAQTPQPPPQRLVRRERLVPSPGYVVIATEANTTTYTRPPNDHPIYSLIGRIAMEWAIIENTLDGCISQLADTSSEITACLTAQLMGHAPRCLTIKALAHWRGLPEIEKDVEQLSNRLSEASDLRNRAIHDRIMIESKGKTPFRDSRMSRKELIYGLKEFNTEIFEGTIDFIRRRQQDCVKLSNKISEQVYEYFP